MKRSTWPPSPEEMKDTLRYFDTMNRPLSKRESWKRKAKTPFQKGLKPGRLYLPREIRSLVLQAFPKGLQKRVEAPFCRLHDITNSNSPGLETFSQRAYETTQTLREGQTRREKLNELIPAPCFFSASPDKIRITEYREYPELFTTTLFDQKGRIFYVLRDE